MPKGVAKDFLRILDGDARDHAIRMGAFGGLALLLVLPAWAMLDVFGVALHGGAVAVGAVLGVLLGHRRTLRLERRMRSTWSEWMRYSLACESVGEVDRRVRGRSQRARVYLTAGGLMALWGAETAIFALALVDGAPRTWAAVAVGANGLFAGALVGASLRLRSWTRMFRGSLADMVHEGEIGVWGAR